MIGKAGNLLRSWLIGRASPPSSSSMVRLMCSWRKLEQDVENAVRAKTYGRIPEMVASYVTSCRSRNLFSFLSAFPPHHRTQIVDEILQTLISTKEAPARLGIFYEHLLFYTLQCPDPLPLSLAVLKFALRSGFPLVPQLYFLLSSAWLSHQNQGSTVVHALSEMRSIGYAADCCTCNYLMLSLCNVGRSSEAKEVLDGMAGAGCVPDTESYGIVISAICAAQKSDDATEMMMEMLVKARLTPREGIVVKLMAALRANRDLWKAVEMLQLLDREGFCTVGFLSYAVVLGGCLKLKKFVLAAKVTMLMTEKGFIPHIKDRQKLIQGLADAGELKLACSVRQRFTELCS